VQQELRAKKVTLAKMAKMARMDWMARMEELATQVLQDL